MASFNRDVYRIGIHYERENNIDWYMSPSIVQPSGSERRWQLSPSPSEMERTVEDLLLLLPELVIT